MRIINNFTQLKLKAIEAISHKYMANRNIDGDRDGLWHSFEGKLRAAHLKDYLVHCHDSNYAAIVAILLALFGKPNEGIFGWKPGRSSRLAGHIAD